MRPFKREVGKRAGWGTDEVNSFVPQAPVETSANNTVRVTETTQVVDEPHRAASQQRPVETEKVERQAKRENENVIKSEKVLELSKEKGDSGTIVERYELPEKGC